VASPKREFPNFQISSINEKASDGLSAGMDLIDGWQVQKAMSVSAIFDRIHLLAKEDIGHGGLGNSFHNTSKLSQSHILCWHLSGGCSTLAISTSCKNIATKSQRTALYSNARVLEHDAISCWLQCGSTNPLASWETWRGTVPYHRHRASCHVCRESPHWRDLELSKMREIRLVSFFIFRTFSVCNPCSHCETSRAIAY